MTTATRVNNRKIRKLRPDKPAQMISISFAKKVSMGKSSLTQLY
jgi:hypothetical protein